MSNQIDANTDMMHAHHADEERNERIATIAEGLLNDMVAEDANKADVIREIMGDDLALCVLVSDLLVFPHLQARVVDLIRERLYALLRVRRCEDAQAQAEQEEAGI